MAAASELVRADPGQLEQVIVNLAVNARDAMPEGGTLTLQTYPVTSADEVRRMQSGDHADRRLYRAQGVRYRHRHSRRTRYWARSSNPSSTTKEVGKGTGLGLSTVYGIVKQTGGFIFADSEIGVGTSFVIYLPVHNAAEPRPAQPAADQAVEVQSGHEAGHELWGTGTILLVEDEAMVRAVGERALTRQGYHVLTASSGEDALDILAGEEQIDLLISDVVMPGMDGPALVARARELYPDLRILFMSGYAEEQLRNSIDIERVAFLSKPFSVQQLGQAARDALAKAS
jgi:two-component system cell cycle sensor histidine kinase/response regulator CckA